MESRKTFCQVEDICRDIIIPHNVKTVLFDLDGVIWRGSQIISGSCECINSLMSRGIRVLFVTNNSTKPAEFFLKKLERVGLDGDLLRRENEISRAVYTSGTAAALLLLSKSSVFNRTYSTTKRELHVYAIAETGFVREFESVFNDMKKNRPSDLAYDIADITGPVTVDDPVVQCDIQNGAEPVVANTNINVVLVGFDAFINYSRLACACSALRNNKSPCGTRRCPLVVTNSDPVLPCADPVTGVSRPMPGAGAMLAAVMACGGRSPSDDDYFYCGKPSADVLAPAINEAEGEGAKLMVGDGMLTDIGFARSSGYLSLLVYSGNTKDEKSARDVCKNKDMEPDFTATSLGDIIPK